MPSYRARLQIGDLLPGHRPEEVMDLAEAAVHRLGLGHACVIGGVAAFLLGVAFWLFSLPG